MKALFVARPEDIPGGAGWEYCFWIKHIIIIMIIIIMIIMIIIIMIIMIIIILLLLIM